MSEAQVTIRRVKGKRVGFYKSVNGLAWFRVPVAEAEGALRTGVLRVGVGAAKVIPC
jgi:hypothetical protein